MNKAKPQSGDTRSFVRWLQAGQPRPYADAVYRFQLRLDIYRLGWEPRKHTPEDLVKKIGRVLGKDWVDKDDPKHNWASPTLKSVRCVAPGVWEFHIVAAYTG
jgi:hypothetical protein